MPPPLRQSHTHAALVCWLDRLSAFEWESAFAPEVLETARAIYRKGEVRELHVLENSVTARACWENGEGAHSVVEWRDARLIWRSSLGSTLLAAAIAAAGIYELEELLGDELSLSAFDVGASDLPAATTEALPPQAAPAEAGGSFATPEVAVKSARVRSLELHFSATDDGFVLCRPFWEDGTPAYGGAENVPEEREGAVLLRFAMRARRAGFVHDGKVGTWVLRAASLVIAGFIKNELPRWAEIWEIYGADEIVPLTHVLDTLVLEAVAESAVDFEPEENFDRLCESDWGSDAPSASEFRAKPAEGTAPRSRQDFSGGFRVRWRLRLGAEWIPDALAQRLFAAPRGGAVYFPGRGTARLSTAQAQALQSWNANGAALAPGGGGCFPAYTLFSLFNDGRLQVSAAPALAAWREAVLSKPEPPEGLPEFLRHYQASGVAWMLRMHQMGIHPLLADEMGLGKTVQTLALLAATDTPVPAAAAGADANALLLPSLVVCPASVIPVWEAEAARFFQGLQTRVLGRDGDWGKAADSPPRRVLWLASYAQLRRHRTRLGTREFGVAVLDEAQFVKNPDTAVSAAVLAIRARRRLALTGTPLENHPRDIWTIFRFLMPGLLGSRETFENAIETDSGAVARITRQIAPFILRRAKESVAPELPPKVTTTLPCPMTSPQRTLYERIAREGLAALETAEGTPFGGGAGLLAYLTRLRQAACDPGLLPGHEAMPPADSGKINVLAEHLGALLAAGRKAVVFSQFVKLLDRVEAVLRTRFHAVPVWRLTGSTTDRAAPVARFQETPGAAIMLVSLRAGGSGVTLHAAESVFLLDPWWNPAVEEQAAARVHRIGQNRPTFVYRMISEDTVESRVETLKSAKAGLFARIVGGIPDMADWQSQLPSLLELLR